MFSPWSVTEGSAVRTNGKLPEDGMDCELDERELDEDCELEDCDAVDSELNTDCELESDVDDCDEEDCELEPDCELDSETDDRELERVCEVENCDVEVSVETGIVIVVALIVTAELNEPETIDVDAVPVSVVETDDWFPGCTEVKYPVP
jgi:hypothetical protein